MFVWCKRQEMGNRHGKALLPKQMAAKTISLPTGVTLIFSYDIYFCSFLQYALQSYWILSTQVRFALADVLPRLELARIARACCSKFLRAYECKTDL
jgi:hypothetical protein